MAVTAAILPAAASAGVITNSTTFATTNQSMWGTGDAVVFTYDEFFGIGEKDQPFSGWNESATLASTSVDFSDSFSIFDPSCFCTRHHSAGIDVATALVGTTSGRTGIEFGLDFDSGSVNAQQDLTSTFVVPDSIQVGQAFALQNQAVTGGPAFTTNFPELQAFADLIVELQAGLDATVKVTGDASVNKTFGIVNATIDEDIELLAFNRDSDGELRSIFLPPGTPQFGEPITLTDGQSNITMFLPVLNTSSATGGQGIAVSSGATDLMNLVIDIDGILVKAAQSGGAPIPPLEADGSISTSSGIFSASAGAGYNLADLEIGPEFDIAQQFQLETQLLSNYQFDRNVNIVQRSADLLFNANSTLLPGGPPPALVSLLSSMLGGASLGGSLLTALNNCDGFSTSISTPLGAIPISGGFGHADGATVASASSYGQPSFGPQSYTLTVAGVSASAPIAPAGVGCFTMTPVVETVVTVSETGPSAGLSELTIIPDEFDIGVTSTQSLVNTFTNRTILDANGRATASALSAYLGVSASADFSDIDSHFDDVSKSWRISGGPVAYVTDVIDLFDIPIFEKSFTLAGFDTPLTTSFVIPGGTARQVAAVPEPAAAWLFLAGLGGLIGLARRRRSEGPLL